MPITRPISASGFSFEHRSFPAGIVETVGVPAHTVTLFSGAPFRAQCERGGRSYVALFKRGDLEIIPKGQAGRWVDEGPGECLIMRVDNSLLHKVTAALGFDPKSLEVLPRVQARDPQLEHLGWALEAASMGGAVVDVAFADAIGVAVAARLVRAHAALRRAPARQALGRRQTEFICDHIDANLAERLSVGDLADVMGMSASHFKSLFRAAVGVSVHRYVVRRRIARAVALIKSGGRALATIAAETGFSHQSHLARAMRSVIGQTPRELMREHH